MLFASKEESLKFLAAYVLGPGLLGADKGSLQAGSRFPF